MSPGKGLWVVGMDVGDKVPDMLEQTILEHAKTTRAGSICSTLRTGSSCAVFIPP